jgi:allantoinase
VVTPAGLESAGLVIRDGRIGAVLPADCAISTLPIDDVGDLVVMAGLVDSHVHVNEPGRTDWEGFETATLAAAAGGVTTLVDMPLNSIPATTSVAGLEAKRRAAEGRCHVDVGFWGGVVPGNTAEIEPLVHAGVLGFKCFMTASGVPEFEAVGEADLRAALPELARLGAVLLAHAEAPGPLEAASRALGLDGAPEGAPERRAYRSWLASRPARAEVEAITLLLELAREFGARVHIVHVSAAEGLEVIASARRAGVPVTAETCPHYLTLAAETIPDGATTCKCAPPIRSRANCAQLWNALGDATLDAVVSDHSPCPPALKAATTGDFFSAWGGIASLELGLSLVWTGAGRRGYPIETVARWMADAPARLAGLGRRKGRIAVGTDADLLVWDPEASFTVDPLALNQRHKLSPYAGMTLKGVVERTYLRGAPIFDRRGIAAQRCGALLSRDVPSWT